MRIELLGALNYAKLKELLKGQVNSEYMIEQIEKLEKERRASIVSAAGRLSRFPGNVLEILGMTEENSYEKNVSFAKRVISMGHDSIIDHDYFVFAVQDVTPVIEQILIEERYSSFTIKSRREVDFSKAGFYTPDFHDSNGNILPDNDKIKSEYGMYMKSLFDKYADFVARGVSLEDARFILPYCYHSNIIMGIDAHVLKDLIIKFTKTKYAKIQEANELGKILKEIATKYAPYILDEIDNKPFKDDSVDEYLEEVIPREPYKILDRPVLLNSSADVDNTILKSAIMRRYQINSQRTSQILARMDKEAKETLMRKIAFSSDGLELTQVSFQFQFPVSYAILTHYTRHRRLNIVTSGFIPVSDLTQYKIPPKIPKNMQEEYNEVFSTNAEMYRYLQEKYNICSEDLIYFTLSGNMVNTLVSMDGKALAHILRLRECTKAQWETRDIANGMHEEIGKLEDAQLFNNILGPTCITQEYCKEGNESCGRIHTIKKKEQKTN